MKRGFSLPYKIFVRILVMALACAVAAIDTAAFYYVATYFFGPHITWPIVAAVFWVQESIFASLVRKELKEDGLL